VGKRPDGFVGVVYEPAGSDPPGREKPDPGKLGRAGTVGDVADDAVPETMVTVV
jgi:hypothetical protein